MQSFGPLSQCDAIIHCHECGDQILFGLGKPLLMLEPYENGTLHPICDDCIDEDTYEVVLATFACQVHRPENGKTFAPTIKQAIAELNVQTSRG